MRIEQRSGVRDQRPGIGMSFQADRWFSQFQEEFESLLYPSFTALRYSRRFSAAALLAIAASLIVHFELLTRQVPKCGTFRCFSDPPGGGVQPGMTLGALLWPGGRDVKEGGACGDTPTPDRIFGLRSGYAGKRAESVMAGTGACDGRE